MKRRLHLWRSGLILALGLCAASLGVSHGKKDWPAPEEAKRLKNPLPANAASLEAAKAIYAEKCAPCHGEAGKGDGPLSVMYDVKPADLTDAHMMAEMTDGEIFWKISEGRQPMPTFKKQLSDEQRWQLVHYLRTFAPKPAAATKHSKAPAKKAASSKP